jgi:SAM-dependent methyltransferase
MAELYGEDLAFIHHTAFGDFSRSAGPEILAFLRAAGLERGRIVDLACGSGILANIFTEAGFSVLGVDASSAMLDIANEQAPEAQFIRSSIWDFDLPRSAAILCIGEGLSYFAPGDPQLNLEPWLRKAYAALEPGGYLIFDLVTGSNAEPMDYRSERHGDGWNLEVHVREDPVDTLLTRTIRITRTVDGTKRHSVEEHSVRIFSAGEVEELLASVGFAVKVAAGYGDFPLPPRRAAYVAHKAHGAF